MTTTKSCTICNRNLPPSMFATKNSTGQLHASCRACESAKVKLKTNSAGLRALPLDELAAILSTYKPLDQLRSVAVPVIVKTDKNEPTSTMTKTNSGWQETITIGDKVSTVINYNNEGRRHGISYVREGGRRYNLTYFNNGINISPWKYTNVGCSGGNDD